MNLGKLIYRNRQQGHWTRDKIIRALVMRRCKFTCQICKRKYTKNRAYARSFPHLYFISAHIDHIIPFSLGGRNHIDNYQLLCRKCNLKKSNNVEE